MKKIRYFSKVFFRDPLNLFCDDVLGDAPALNAKLLFLAEKV